jgi:hypothetical protein
MLLSRIMVLAEESKVDIQFNQRHEKPMWRKSSNLTVSKAFAMSTFEKAARPSSSVKELGGVLSRAKLS